MKNLKRLFQVTLPWNPNDTSEGDFSEMVWAVDSQSATLELANRMRSLKPELTTSKDQNNFIQNLINGASPSCTIDLHAELLIYLEALFRGPSLILTPKRAQALQEIFRIMEANGVKKPYQQ